MNRSIRKNKYKTVIFALAFLFFTLFFNATTTQAATIANRKVELSDSGINQKSTYDFEGDLSGGAIKCIKVDFCTSASGSCVGPTGFTTLGASKAPAASWNGFTYANWSYTSIDANTFKISSTISDSPTTDASWAIAGITNSSVSGTYYALINTYTNQDCTGAVDSGTVAFVNTAGGVSVSLTIPGGTNPVPTLSSINPSSKMAGEPGFTMTLTGTNFISSSVVRFAGSSRSTTYVNSTTLTAEILASDIRTPGDYNITVFNPTPGGGESNALVLAVRSGGGGGNPSPTLTAINPTSKNQGDPGFTMTLTGTNFISSSVARFAGSNRTTTYINSTTLQAQIPASDLQRAGDFNITVFNPSPGGGESGPVVFRVIPVGEVNPIPILTSISPNVKTVGDGTFTMTLTGTNFISSSVARFAGSNRTTTYINSTTLQAQIPASDLQRAGDFNITVFNPSPGGGESSAVVFRVNNPVPTLTSIEPTWKYVGSSGFTMTLTGNNFISSSVVRFAGSNRNTTYINSTTLTAEILATDLANPGNFNITVFNPTPGGGESSAQIFRVIRITENPPPTLTSIEPTWKYVGSAAFSMTLTGTNFISSSVVRFAGSARTTTYINSTRLQAYILLTDLQTAGDFNITVFNPGPGGGESAPKIFRVIRITENPSPTLTSIEPTWRYINSGGFTMTLTGNNFISSSVVRFAGSDRLTNYINSTTLQAQIPGSDLQTAGDFNITVFNPAPGGGESEAVIFKILIPSEEEEEEKKPGGAEKEIIAPIILEPLNGTYLNKKIVNIKGLAPPGKTVDIFANDQKIKTTLADENGNFATVIELEEGSYFVQASVQDKRSSGINLVIDLTPPEPPQLLEVKVINQNILIDKINFSLLVKGENPDDAASLRIVVNPDFTFPTTGGSWEKTLNLSLPAGKHQVYAFVYDLAGNISNPSNILEFEISLLMPLLPSIISPLAITPPLKEITEVTKKIIDNPQAEKVVTETSKVALPVTTAVSLGAAASAFASAGISLSQILLVLYLIFVQPFVLFFYKRKRRGWGVVYNSLTKQPVDLAPIRLFDAKTNRLVATKISDREGRYLLTVDPGSYKITVNKPEYIFPSKILAGFTEDFHYSNLYYGQEIEVKEKNTVINANIPLDPDKKLKSNEWLIKDYLNFSLKKAIPIAALIFSFLAFIVNPQPVLLIPFVFNLLFFIIIKSLRPSVRRDWGIVSDKQNKKPLRLAVVRIFESTFNKLIDQQVTNIRGQYGFLVGGRKFYLTYNKTGYREKQSQILDFENEEKGKVVNLDVYLERQKDENNRINKGSVRLQENLLSKDSEN